MCLGWKETHNCLTNSKRFHNWCVHLVCELRVLQQQQSLYQFCIKLHDETRLVHMKLSTNATHSPLALLSHVLLWQLLFTWNTLYIHSIFTNTKIGSINNALGPTIPCNKHFGPFHESKFVVCLWLHMPTLQQLPSLQYFATRRQLASQVECVRYRMPSIIMRKRKVLHSRWLIVHVDGQNVVCELELDVHKWFSTTISNWVENMAHGLQLLWMGVLASLWLHEDVYQRFNDG